jgi:hypothetical protein
MSQIVTKTMAEILMQQGHIEEAYQIFKTLSEIDPSDMEIKEKLKELSEKIGPLSPGQSIPATEERVRTLEKWLANIRERKKA